jgi:hypothetical protein
MPKFDLISGCFNLRVLRIFAARLCGLHLYGETVVSDIVKQDNSIIMAIEVKRRRDLEDIRMGFNYLKDLQKILLSEMNYRSYDLPIFLTLSLGIAIIL